MKRLCSVLLVGVLVFGILNMAAFADTAEDAEPMDICDMLETAQLSRESYIYDGTDKEPKVTIPDLTEGKDFVVEYEKNIQPGYAQAHIQGIGSWCNDMILEYVIRPRTPVLSVTVEGETGKPELKWEIPKDSTVYQYEIYRSTQADKGFAYIDETAPLDEQASPYLDDSATAGVKYYYKIKAIADGGEVLDSTDSTDSVPLTKPTTKTSDSNFSKVKSVTCDLAKPTVSISTLSVSGKPKLTWEAIPEASKYAVYRAFKKDGPYKKLYTTSKTSYTHASAMIGKQYYYKVQAIYSGNSKANSLKSQYQTIVCDCARPVVSIKRSANGKPKLSWKAVAVASKYEIWRATSKNGKYTKVYTTKNLSYTNTKAKSGKCYYYKVRAVCGKTKYGNSAYSLKKKIVSK